MSTYHEIIERLPAILVKIVHSYAHPETTWVYTKVYEIRKFLKETNVGYYEKCYELFFEHQSLNYNMHDNKLLQRLNGLIRFLPELLRKKTNGKYDLCEFEKHSMEYFIEKKGD